MKSTRDLLKESFGSIPNAFAYREVRFHVYQALQKLESLEKKEGRRKDLAETNKLEADKKKAQVWMPPIYQNASQLQHTLDTIDKMIAVEQKAIQDIHAKNNKKGQVETKKDVDEDDDPSQTLHG